MTTVADSPLSDNIQARLKRETRELVADLDAEGGTDVCAEEIRDAIDQLDQQVLLDVASALIAGYVEEAESELQSASGLSDDEVAELVDGMSTRLQELMGTAGDAETATDNTLAVLWSAFGVAALSLVACIFVGWIGTEDTREIDVRLTTAI